MPTLKTQLDCFNVDKAAGFILANFFNQYQNIIPQHISINTALTLNSMENPTIEGLAIGVICGGPDPCSTAVCKSASKGIKEKDTFKVTHEI